tara:strand:- start:4520 stop:4843 length:324 start_codon:yes stop_codon:yes gene_type:complete
MENPVETVASKLSEEEKDLIVSLKSANDIQMRNNLYSNPALNEFFRLWSVHFPSVKQSINCKGCRETVVKFYSRVADFVSNERIEKKIVVETVKPKIKKKKKVLSKK